MSDEQAGFPVTFTETFDGLYGLVIDGVDIEAGTAQAHVDIEPHHLQPLGLVHGGVHASVAETLASMATWIGVRDQGMSAQGLSNQTSFLRPILAGTLHANGTVKHRGRTTWVWEIEISDDDGRLCSLVRMTIAVRPVPAS